MILTGKNRIRICGVGIIDIINYDSNNQNQNDYTEFQKEDFIALGQLLLCICTRNANSYEDMKTSLAHVKDKYSTELNDLITKLITMEINTVEQFNSIPKFIDHVFKDNLHSQKYNIHFYHYVLELLFKFYFLVIQII